MITACNMRASSSESIAATRKSWARSDVLCACVHFPSKCVLCSQAHHVAEHCSVVLEHFLNETLGSLVCVRLTLLICIIQFPFKSNLAGAQSASFAVTLWLYLSAIEKFVHLCFTYPACSHIPFFFFQQGFQPLLHRFSKTREEWLVSEEAAMIKQRHRQPTWYYGLLKESAKVGRPVATAPVFIAPSIIASSLCTPVLLPFFVIGHGHFHFFSKCHNTDNAKTAWIPLSEGSLATSCSK